MISQTTHCPEKTWFNCLLLRSCGIPTVIDFVPVARVHTLGHEWNAIKLKNGTYPFEPFWVDSQRYLKAIYSGKVNEPKLGPINFPKVYRKTYELNINELLKHSINSNEVIPDFFKNPFQQDVTKDYLKTYDIKSAVLINTNNIEFGYACVMGEGQTWVPVDFGKINGKEIIFNSLGPNNIYLPVIFKSNSLVPTGYPVLLNEKGKSVLLKPDPRKRQSIKISYVAYPRPELEEYKEAFKGVTVEGSNSCKFENGKTLYKIQKAYEPGIHSMLINEPVKYRYIRILIPKLKIKLNEVKVFSSENGRQKEIIGSLISSYTEDNALFQKLLDGDLISNVIFNQISEKHKLLNKVWFGLDFKNSKTIHSIEIYFVFDSNIRKGGVYELLYWDFGWQSLGIKKLSQLIQFISRMFLKTLC